jgi:hypothetical protein
MYWPPADSGFLKILVHVSSVSEALASVEVAVKIACLSLRVFLYVNFRRVLKPGVLFDMKVKKEKMNLQQCHNY